MSEDTRQRQIAPAIETSLEHLLAAVDVPGLALAIVRAGELEPPICCSIRDARSPIQVDKDTVFDAASLSKPAFAHSVLQLIDEGVLSLDTPLAHYLPGYFQGDDRAALWCMKAPSPVSVAGSSISGFARRPACRNLSSD
jgi:CubicO group peptidase (beta-lactamase class C family)